MKKGTFHNHVDDNILTAFSKHGWNLERDQTIANPEKYHAILVSSCKDNTIGRT